MKKLRNLILVCIMVLPLTGCFTMMGIVMSSLDYRYNAEARVIGQLEEKIPTDSKVAVYYNNAAIRDRTVLENAVVNTLKEQGINAYACIDAFMRESKSESFNLYNALHENNTGILIDIEFGDIYTYTNGGGLKSIDVVAYVVDTDIWSDNYGDDLVAISGYVESSDNDFESYGETMPYAMDKLGRALGNAIIQLFNPVAK